MTAEHFVATHRADWMRLDSLVDRAQKARLTSLSDDELHELGALYRRAAADLARARTRHSDTQAGRELVRSLNDLVLRAHSQVYSAPSPRPARALHFLLFGFPASFRRQWRAIAIAAVLLFGPGIVAHLAVVVNSDLAPLMVPEDAIKQVQKRAQQKVITGWGANTDYGGLVTSAEMSSYIMTNNIRVTFIALALGVTGGIGTAILLVSNGLMVGGLSGVATNSQVDLLFWAVILPHGVLELTAICIGGGAGLVLARAIYAPGALPRRDALRLAGTEAVRLIVGATVLLLFAGVIEGFFTPLPLPPLLKLTFAAFSAIVLVAYLSARPRRATV